MSAKKSKMTPEVISAIQSIEIKEILAEMYKMLYEQQPLGLMEPLILTVTSDPPTEIKPAFPWFSVTIVKEDPVELHIILNSHLSMAKPDTMHADEKVWDQYFSKPVIQEVTLSTNTGETCRVRVRGSR